MLAELLDTGYLTLTTKTTLVLNRESLDMICAPYFGEEQVAEFETLFTAVKYICFDALLKKDGLWYMNSTTDSYPSFLGLNFEDYYIDFHIYSYSKTTNRCWKRKEIKNLMIVNI